MRPRFWRGWRTARLRDAAEPARPVRLRCAGRGDGRRGLQGPRPRGRAGRRRRSWRPLAGMMRLQHSSIFNTQYAEGKDLGAMLDELCAVARDLLHPAHGPAGRDPDDLRHLHAAGAAHAAAAAQPGRAAAHHGRPARYGGGLQCQREPPHRRRALPCAPVRAGGQSGRASRSMPACAAWRSVWRAASCPSRLQPQAEQAQQETGTRRRSRSEPEAAPEPQQPAPIRRPRRASGRSSSSG